MEDTLKHLNGMHGLELPGWVAGVLFFVELRYSYNFCVVIIIILNTDTDTGTASVKCRLCRFCAQVVLTALHLLQDCVDLKSIQWSQH